jgi:hypothetical protein
MPCVWEENICAIDCWCCVDMDSVYLGLMGEDIDDLRAAVVAVVMGEGVDADEVAVLRKTRAGGNWLIGGMVAGWVLV